MKILFLSVAFLAVQAQKTAVNPIKPCSLDESSYSNVDVIRTTDFALDVTVDFDNRVLSGSNTFTMLAVQDTSEAIFDFQGMNILSVSYKLSTATEFVATTFDTQTDPVLGSALRVYLDDKVFAKDTLLIQIAFKTTSESIAINWLNPKQTASESLNYMFTKCEPIHCRSIAPLQDTPSIKATYSATVRVPQHYSVYMSAIQQNKTTSPEGLQSYQFRQDIQIPSYLLAFAIGNLTYQSTGNRTGVIAEPNVIGAYTEELDSLQTLLDNVEAYMGKYIWGNYTIIVLPPSFPVGGMENPLLTFASPTIITGNKTQIYVATHEIAHSWTGNDVTCRDWHNLWLNEGMTTFIERKISGQMHGEEFAVIEGMLGNVSLWADIESFGESDTYSSLYPIQNGRSPDGSNSQVPYEKGYQFMLFLESIMKTKADFQSLLSNYVKTYSLQSITFLEFKDYHAQFVTTLYKDDPTFATTLLAKVEWDKWIYQGGAIPVPMVFNSPLAVKFQTLADGYISLGGQSSPPNFGDYLTESNPNLKVIFLNQLLQRSIELTVPMLTKIDSDLHTTDDNNPEIGQRWFPLAISMAYTPCFPAALHYVSTIGRQKYILPVYQALVRSGFRGTAIEWFTANKDFYHPITVIKIKDILSQA